MIATTNCQHCGNGFEIDGMNGTEFCPHCGKETSIVAQVSAPAPASTTGTPSTAATLKQIRQQTCYETLRGLIDLVQALFFIAAGLPVLEVVRRLLERNPDSNILIVATLGLLLALLLGFILVVLGIAWKQAALLLVDIADCQIRLAGNTASR